VKVLSTLTDRFPIKEWYILVHFTHSNSYVWKKKSTNNFTTNPKPTAVLTTKCAGRWKEGQGTVLGMAVVGSPLLFQGHMLWHNWQARKYKRQDIVLEKTWWKWYEDEDETKKYRIFLCNWLSIFCFNEKLLFVCHLMKKILLYLPDCKTTAHPPHTKHNFQDDPPLLPHIRCVLRE
jgi:hypothetical protein